MLKDIVQLKYRPSFVTFLAFIGAVAYIILPNDLVGDHKLIIGIADDLFVVLVFLKFLSRETHRYARYKALCRKC